MSKLGTVFPAHLTLADRKKESAKLLQRYGARVPIVVHSASDGLVIPKPKYLVPKEITLGQFLFLLRQKIPKLEPQAGLFIRVGKSCPPISQSLEELYEKEKNDDGFLYLNLSREQVFG